MSYNYKMWKQARFTNELASEEMITLIKKYLIPGSVLDVGCGNGRYAQAFDGREYLGIDISPLMIEAAKNNFNDSKKFAFHDIVTWEPTKRWNNIFTSVVLQHLPPDLIEGVLEKLKRWADNLICIESKKSDKEWSGHCFGHDYEAMGLSLVEELPNGVGVYRWSM